MSTASPAIDEGNLLSHLDRAGLLPGGVARTRVESAGEGNINFVWRVRLADGGSLVVKHARPTLARFPQYTAPVARLAFEHRYTATVSEIVAPADLLPPRIVHFDPELHLLVMEDLGSGPDLGQALAAGTIPSAGLDELGRFLAQVHRGSAARAAQLAPSFANTEMQRLHGEHIFTLPYEGEGFPVEAAVRASANRALDASVRARIRALRARYYESRDALVHADVQTSNLLLRSGRLRLLDAEIAHLGDPAFDVGTTLAHLHVHQAIRPQRTELRAASETFLEAYAKAGGGADVRARAHAYAGVEMLRRTLGAARFGGVPDAAAAARIVADGASLVREARL
jgi:5-methylthioribose kinase